MKESISLQVEHVSKQFKLPHEKNNSIKAFVTQSIKRRKTSRQDTRSKGAG